MRDFNVNIEGNNKDVERYIGTHGVGSMSQNGVRLLEFWELSNTVVSNTFFLQKDIHQITWNSPEYITKA